MYSCLDFFYEQDKRNYSGLIKISLNYFAQLVVKS
jgi:hypothetical protein